MSFPSNGVARALESGIPLPPSVRAVLREFPGMTEVRAHQIVKERRIMRARAARQARRNLAAPPPFGGVGRAALRLIESDSHAGDLW